MVPIGVQKWTWSAAHPGRHPSYFCIAPLPQLSIALELCFTAGFGFATALFVTAFTGTGFFVRVAFVFFFTAATVAGLASLLVLSLAAGAFFMGVSKSRSRTREAYSSVSPV